MLILSSQRNRGTWPVWGSTRMGMGPVRYTDKLRRQDRFHARASSSRETGAPYSHAPSCCMWGSEAVALAAATRQPAISLRDSRLNVSRRSRYRSASNLTEAAAGTKRL